MTHADTTQDLTLLANTPANAESLMHILEQAPEGINLDMNAYKTEYIRFKQKENISILSGGPPK